MNKEIEKKLWRFFLKAPVRTAKSVEGFTIMPNKNMPDLVNLMDGAEVVSYCHPVSLRAFVRDMIYYEDVHILRRFVVNGERYFMWVCLSECETYITCFEERWEDDSI